MIYKDAHAHLDTERTPAARHGEACVNCGEWWEEHDGWRCPDAVSLYTTFHGLVESERYTTMSMYVSIQNDPPTQRSPATCQESAVQVVVKADLSDWRTWAHNRPGDCPCGIARTMCDYHRG